ncbi:uncharacterized protein V6R79_006614 [Siganus canaliculatus]
MSFLSTVEQAISACKAEQTEINERIQFYRDVLQALVPTLKTGFEETDSADAATPNTDVSQVEKEDIELLEQALEKALQVRAGSGSSRKDSNSLAAPQKELGPSHTASKEGIPASAHSKGNKTRPGQRKEQKKPATSASSTLGSKSSASCIRSQSKSSTDRNIIQNCLGNMHHQATRKSQQAVSVLSSPDPGQLHISSLCSKNKTVRNNVLSGNDLGKAAAISMPSSNTTVAVSHTGGSHNVPQQNGMASDQIAKWKCLRAKESRLWDKVVTLKRKPAAGRSHFMEKMRTTFPKDWPCGSPDQTRALIDRLTHQGHDLTQQKQTRELLAKLNPEEAGEPGSRRIERLQMTATELRNLAGQVKRDWETWDQWRPEGGCLCPSGAKGVWEDAMSAPLPLTITYRTEGALQELERLRMRVALLQQEIHLEQVRLVPFKHMCDAPKKQRYCAKCQYILCSF